MSSELQVEAWIVAVTIIFAIIAIINNHRRDVQDRQRSLKQAYDDGYNNGFAKGANKGYDCGYSDACDHQPGFHVAMEVLQNINGEIETIEPEQWPHSASVALKEMRHTPASEVAQ